MNPVSAGARRASALCAVLLLTAACGLTPPQRADVAAFGRSATALADVARDEFLETREQVVDMNRRRYLMDDDAVDPAELGGLMTRERLDERLLALDALADYGHALTLLLGAADADQRATAVNSFVTGLGKIDGLGLEPQQAGMLTKVATNIGGLAVEAKRRAAIEQVVETVNDAVIELADIVASEFDPVNGAWVQAYDLTALELRGRMVDAGYSSAMRRKEELEHAERRTRLEHVAWKIVDAAEQLAYAQETLRQSLADPRINRLEVQAFVGLVHELRASRAALDGTPPPRRTGDDARPDAPADPRRER